jgi:hypothetical protein
MDFTTLTGVNLTPTSTYLVRQEYYFIVFLFACAKRKDIDLGILSGRKFRTDG